MELHINGWKVPAVTVLLAFLGAIAGGLLNAALWQTEITLRVQALAAEIGAEKVERQHLELHVSELSRSLAKIDGQLSIIVTNTAPR